MIATVDKIFPTYLSSPPATNDCRIISSQQPPLQALHHPAPLEMTKMTLKRRCEEGEDWSSGSEAEGGWCQEVAAAHPTAQRSADSCPQLRSSCPARATGPGEWADSCCHHPLHQGREAEGESPTHCTPTPPTTNLPPHSIQILTTALDLIVNHRARIDEVRQHYTALHHRRGNLQVECDAERSRLRAEELEIPLLVRHSLSPLCLETETLLGGIRTNWEEDQRLTKLLVQLASELVAFRLSFI